MTNSQRVAVEVKDSTAKLIMGTLTDVGVSFDYQRVQGQTLTARVSVAGRNGQTLLKVRDVVQDRQSRAPIKSGGEADKLAVAALQRQLNEERAQRSQTCDQSGMPPGFTAHYDSQLGYWWYCATTDRTSRAHRSLEDCQKHALEKYQASQASA